MKLKSILLAAMLAVSAGGALADDVGDNVSMATVDFVNYTAHFGANHVEAGLFTDTFVFNPAVGPSLANGLIHSLSLFDTANLDLYTVTLNGHALNLVSTGSFEYQLLNPVAVSGLLTLIVKGNTITPAASYSGDINVSAVPEPETYGMLLAGLGVVGFLARRRRQART